MCGIVGYEGAKARSGIVVAVASDGDHDIAGWVDHVLYVPPASELLTSAIPLQLLAYHIAVLRGCDRSEERRVGKECRSRWCAYASLTRASPQRSARAPPPSPVPPMR